MDSNTHTQPLQAIQTRTRSGPTSTITQATTWQWYELTWAILVVALFGTAGRVIDFIVAGGLIITWLAGPAIVVSITGHLAVIGLEIFPEVAWAVVAMELLLIAPLIIELGLLAPSRRTAIQTQIGILMFSGVTAAGVWISIPVRQLSAILGVLFSVGVVVLYLEFGYTNTDDALTAESNENAIEQPSSAEGEIE